MRPLACYIPTYYMSSLTLEFRPLPPIPRVLLPVFCYLHPGERSSHRLQRSSNVKQRLALAPTALAPVNVDERCRLTVLQQDKLNVRILELDWRQLLLYKPPE